MTIFGAHVLAADLAVAWADSESFDERDNFTGFMNKLVIGPGGFAFTMTGWASVLARAASCVVNAPDFATALERLPWVLRRASGHAVDTTPTWSRNVYVGQRCVLIGYDPAAGRMTAYRFAATENFAAVLDERQTAPCVPTYGLRPDGPHQIRSIAERQLAALREEVPHAVGGPLHVAVIRPDGVTCSRLCNLADDFPAPIVSELEPAHVH